MATTITSSFAKFRSNLEVTGLQGSTLSTRQQAVRTAVEKDFSVLKSFLTGSYRRSTLIAPLKEADVDIFVVLDSGYYKADGHAALLDKLRATLLKTYTSSPKISRNGHAVTITFTDFVVDVVPAFNRQGGGYLIPDSVGKRWISTDPTVHVTLMSNQNSIHGGDLVPAVKMIKRWNREISRAFGSFYLELIAIEIFKNVTMTDDPSAVRYFFDHARTKVKTKAIDPAGLGDQINGLAGASSVDAAVKRVETAHGRAVRAEQLAVAGKISDAVAEWQKLFGGYFPSYG
jgi:hypothetical protein